MLDVFEMRCLMSMIGVTRMDRGRDEEVRRLAGIVRKMSEWVDQGAELVWTCGGNG